MHGLFFFRGEDCIRVFHVTGVQTCALPLFPGHSELALDVAVGDILEGKLIYDGSVHADGHVEGELRVTGNIDVATGASVKALLEGANVTLKGQVEGMVTARDKLTLGKNARLSGDIQVRRLQIDDGATLNGHEIGRASCR